MPRKCCVSLCKSYYKSSEQNVPVHRLPRNEDDKKEWIKMMFLHIGLVSSIESNHRSVELARQPEEVCIKIEGIPGEAPKMVGRHFEVNDLLVSKISRDSINALKDWFRDDMTKTDWQLIIELKKLFEII